MISVNASAYELSGRMTIMWNVPGVSKITPMGIWLFDTSVNPQPPYTDEKWPLVYNENPNVSSYTISLSRVSASIPNGNALRTGSSFKVIVFIKDNNTPIASSTPFSLNNYNSLAVVLQNGNSASTDIDMTNRSITSSTGPLNVGTGTIVNMNGPIKPTYLPSAITSSHVGYVLPFSIFESQDLIADQPRNCVSISIPPGVWILLGQCECYAPNPVGYQLICFNNTIPASTTISNTTIMTDPLIITNIQCQDVISISTTQTWHLVAQSGVNRRVFNLYGRAIRIA